MAGNIFSGLAEGIQAGQAIKARREERADRAQDREMRQQEFGMRQQEFAQQSELNEFQLNKARREEELNKGLTTAFQDGGFEGALDYLKHTDAKTYMEVTKQKADIDQAIASTANTQALTDNQKQQHLQNAYTLLGKMGATLQNMPPNDRPQAYQQMLPILKSINPKMPDNYTKETETMFTAMMGLSMPESILYRADKINATAQTDIGKASQDINLLRTQGVSDDDPRIIALQGRITVAQKNADRAVDDKLRYAKNEDEMRKEFESLSGPFREMSNMYNGIKNMSFKDADATPATDMLLINSVQRIQDPGQGVREGDYATVKNTGSWPARARAEYNKAKNGTILSETQRKHYLDMAHNLMKEKQAAQDKLVGQVQRIADGRGYNVKNVTLDFSPPGQQQQSSGPSPEWIQEAMKLNPGSTEQDAMAAWQYQNQQKGGAQ